jgi:hypothetical protein
MKSAAMKEVIAALFYLKCVQESCAIDKFIREVV